MERTVTVVPEAGLHARPAAEFVETASEYDGEIIVSPVGSDESADARSMLAVSGLGVEVGDDVTVRAEGADAEAALDALEAVLTAPTEGSVDADADSDADADDQSEV